MCIYSLQTIYALELCGKTHICKPLSISLEYFAGGFTGGPCCAIGPWTTQAPLVTGRLYQLVSLSSPSHSHLLRVLCRGWDGTGS